MNCPDCAQDPCCCAEWEESLRRAEVEEAEAAATFAETMLSELWFVDANGLFRRKS